MELKKELLEFLEANNLFGLEDRENAKGVVDSYLKVYKKQLTLTDVSQQSELVCTLHSACQYRSGFNECSYLLQCDYKKQTCG